MPRNSRFLIAGLCCLSLMPRVQAADHVPTHVLQAVALDVKPARPDARTSWDTGIGAFRQPDPQVTLLRDDPRAVQAATDLLLQVMEQRMKEEGREITPQLTEAFARMALSQLRCGAVIDALDHQPLKDARSKFAADTVVVSDTLHLRVRGGGLNVAQGDKVAIFVNDIDLAAHDVLGETTLDITKELLLKGEVELKFNSVDALRLTLVPLKK